MPLRSSLDIERQILLASGKVIGSNGLSKFRLCSLPRAACIQWLFAVGYKGTISHPKWDNFNGSPNLRASWRGRLRPCYDCTIACPNPLPSFPPTSSFLLCLFPTASISSCCSRICTSSLRPTQAPTLAWLLATSQLMESSHIDRWASHQWGCLHHSVPGWESQRIFPENPQSGCWPSGNVLEASLASHRVIRDLSHCLVVETALSVFSGWKRGSTWPMRFLWPVLFIESQQLQVKRSLTNDSEK